MAPRIRYPVPDLDLWSSARYQIPLKRDPNDMSWDGGRRAGDFEVPHIRFEENPQDDTAWHYQKTLGRGGFGLVGLWAKKDWSDATVDELAVKEMPMPYHNTYRLSPDGQLLPEEAIIQTMLQKKNCMPVLQLRGLSLLTEPAGYHDKLRLYLEYCPNGSLHGVLRQYSHILSENPNSAQTVPEPYLWQLLYDFAQVMRAMEQPPFEHPLLDTLGSSPYVLHLDVKMANVMLGDLNNDDIVQGYPSCKVGDWGLAKLTSHDDPRNSSNWTRAGTRCWYPPEQYDQNRFGQFWQRRPPWRIPGSWNDHPYTTAHSVYGFASIIFRLMVVDVDRSMLESIVENASHSERHVSSRGFRMVKSSDMDRHAYDGLTRYSPLLKDTIASCLHFDPKLRPTATYLQELASNMCTSLSTYQYQDGVNTFPDLQVDSQDSSDFGIRW